MAIAIVVCIIKAVTIYYQQLHLLSSYQLSLNLVLITVIPNVIVIFIAIDYWLKFMMVTNLSFIIVVVINYYYCW